MNSILNEIESSIDQAGDLNSAADPQKKLIIAIGKGVGREITSCKLSALTAASAEKSNV